MQNSRLFSKTIISFPILKIIRKVITLKKKAGTSSRRARLNKVWPKQEKNFSHVALIVEKKKSRPFAIFSDFISLSRLFPGLETVLDKFQDFFKNSYEPRHRIWRQFAVAWILILHHCQTYGMQRVCFGLLYSRACSLSKCWEWGKSVIFKTLTCISVEFGL